MSTVGIGDSHITIDFAEDCFYHWILPFCLPGKKFRVAESYKREVSSKYPLINLTF